MSSTNKTKPLFPDIENIYSAAERLAGVATHTPLMHNLNLSEKYEANIADDGQFPNHTDKDIWMSGFKAAIDAFAKNQIIVHHINNATTLH